MPNGKKPPSFGPRFANTVAEPIPVMTGLRVLLLDNDAETLRLTTEILAAEGCTAYACTTCDQAAHMAALVRPTAILFHGCDGEEKDVYDALLLAAPQIPIVRYSTADDQYELFIVHRNLRGYVRAGRGYRTIRSAIRAAVMQCLEQA